MMPPARRSLRSLAAVLAAGAAVAAPRAARADGDGDGDDHDATTTADAAAHAAESGAFLASALAARSDGRRGLVSILGGYDQVRHGGVYDATAEAQLLGPLSLRAGASYDGPGTSSSPHLELRLDTLRQGSHGIDLAIAGGYTGASFNDVPAAVLKVALGRSVGASYLLANLTYEHGLEDGERAGELRLAALYPVGHGAHVGLDSRFQVDLERGGHDPAGETEWEWRSGMVASYAWDRFVLTGSGGVSALRLHGTATTALGPAVMAGLGTVF